MNVDDRRRMSRTVFGYAIYLPELFVLGAGIYGFLQSGLWDDMRMIGAMCVAVHYLIAAVQMLKEKMK